MIVSALVLAGSFVLFLAGMQLSAFFSGSETGFYRVSQLQLTLQKQQGDPAARHLMEFVEHPTRFVSTTLVGNNVANYLTTLAIGLFVAEASGVTESSGGLEIMATLLLTPVIFVFGELIPKSLYYRSPLSLLRSRCHVFRLCYFLFLPLSYPLTLVAGLLSRISGHEQQPIDTMFGRTRMFGLIASGQRDGILTQIQARMADNLMTSGKAVLASMMDPADLLPGMPETSNRDSVLAVAESSGSGWILLYPDGCSGQWSSIVRIATLLKTELTPRAVAEPLSKFSEEEHPLIALSEMFRAHARFGIVVDEDDGQITGLVRRDALAETLLITQRSAPGHKTAWEL